MPILIEVDRHHGYAYSEGRNIYLNFNTSWKEGRTKIGVVKGTDPFLSSRGTIPQGKVLFIKK